MAKQPTITIRIAVSSRLHAYLGVLARNTMLGASENDVAAYVLTHRLDEMLAENYHEKHKVPE